MTPLDTLSLMIDASGRTVIVGAPEDYLNSGTACVCHCDRNKARAVGTTWGRNSPTGKSRSESTCLDAPLLPISNLGEDVAFGEFKHQGSGASTHLQEQPAELKL